MNGNVKWRWIILPLVLLVLVPIIARRTAYSMVEKNGLIS